jgi:hypothetical protein
LKRKKKRPRTEPLLREKPYPELWNLIAPAYVKRRIMTVPTTHIADTKMSRRAPGVSRIGECFERGVL